MNELKEFDRERFRDLIPDNITFKQTSTAYPEQYDVFDGNILIGRLRLRGIFTAQNSKGDEVYYAEPRLSDGWFEGDEDLKYIAEGVNSILDNLNKTP